MLRLKGHSIINLKDFEKYADFQELYKQMDEFVKFAQVHCVPIELLDNQSKPMQYLNKQFWLKLLIHVFEKGLQKRTFEKKEDYQTYITDACIQFYEIEKRRLQIQQVTMCNMIPKDVSLWSEYVEQAIVEYCNSCNGQISEEELEDIRTELEKPFTMDNSCRKAIREEAERLQIPERLKKLQKQSENGMKILVCISAQMITELATDKLNLEKISCENCTEENILVLRESRKAVRETEEIKTDTLPVRKGRKAVREKTECLPCRKEPYIWPLYEEKVLPEFPNSQFIQTIKVEAVAGIGNSVTIYLFSFKKKEIVFEIQLKKGAYRYCNITDNGVIIFLDIRSACGKKQIYRPYPDKGELYVENGEGEKIKLPYGTEVSCFSISNEGEIYLRNGEAIVNRYMFLKKNTIAMNSFERVSHEEFVDVKLLDNGFLLLNNRGIIRSNILEWNGKKAVKL